MTTKLQTEQIQQAIQVLGLSDQQEQFIVKYLQSGSAARERGERRATFYQWLLTQTPRADLVGDFARTIEADDNAPHRGGRGRWRKYLEWKSAPADVERAFEAAWAEYSR